MIDLGLSDEYLAGYRARLNGLPFDKNETNDWKMGWMNANQALKLKGVNKEIEEMENYEGYSFAQQ